MIDLLFKDGLVVTERDERFASVGVDGETIAFVGPARDAPAPRRTVDCEGRFVLPGLIDSHFHIGQQPGPPPPLERWREDVGPETRAAALGGVTTVLAMYARQQPYAPLLRQLIEWGNRESHIDFNFHPIVQSAAQIDEMDELFAMGVTSYKFFFDAYKGWEGQQIALDPLDAGLLHRAFVRIARLGDAVGLIHAEDQDLIYELQQNMRASGRTDLGAWTDSRPNLVELTKSLAAIETAKLTGAALYIVHVGAAEVADLVAAERRAGHRNIYAETCVHYLTHHGNMEAEVGSWGKVNNALKSRQDNDRLWRGIAGEGITNMGTDHVCWTRAEKEQGGGKFGNIWGAMPGIVGGTEQWLPVMLTYGVGQGRISLSDLVRVTSTANARTFGLYPRKGVIAPGADADLVIVDPEQEVSVEPERFYASPAARTWSIYEGWRFRGLPVLTTVRGTIVAEDGQIVGEPSGRYLPRPVRARRAAPSVAPG